MALKRRTKLDCKQQKCSIGTDGTELPVELLHVSQEKEDNEATAVIAPVCFQTHLNMIHWSQRLVTQHFQKRKEQ